ncbi:hypothetical protein DFS34DRAFT_595253 [Phlyctochytrium arcticum]|nr:hypothetical protein DFS34DRAFT_595253 [Phlyctochytrium arcticum]
MTLLRLATSLLLLVAGAYSQSPSAVTSTTLTYKNCIPKGGECLALSNFPEIESGSFIVYNLQGINNDYLEAHIADVNLAGSTRCSVTAEYISSAEHERKDVLLDMSPTRFAEALLMHNQTAKVPVSSFFPLLAINIRDDIALDQPGINMFLPDHQGVLSWGTNWQSTKNRTVRFEFSCLSFGLDTQIEVAKPGTKTQVPGSLVEPAPLPDLARFLNSHSSPNSSHGTRREVTATINVLAVIVVAVLCCGSL